LSRAYEPQPALGRWKKESTTMKKIILKTALLMATVLSVPTAANASTLTYSYDDGSTIHFEGTFEGELDSDNNLFAIDRTKTGSGGFYKSGNYQAWTLKTIGLDQQYSYPGNAFPSVTLDGSFMDVNAFSDDNAYGWNAGVNNTLSVYQAGTLFGLNNGAEFLSATFNAGYWDASVSISPIPEPETCTLMLACLAVVGAAARRRKAK
jgi:hypothetical protein